MRTRLTALTLATALIAAPALAVDADHDGVDDAVDKCPDTAQIKKVSPDFKYARSVNPERLSKEPMAVPVDADGCELDSDGDGVVDRLDYCPNDPPIALSKGVTRSGCPISSDGDGTPDYRDRCPDTPRGVRADRHGCPVEG